VGRDLQREYGQEPQVVMTMPLLIGTDGVEKMSKSLGNYIAICDEPDQMFGKTMSIPDTLIYDYFRLSTYVDAHELEEVKRQLEQPDINPMNLKKRLARRLVEIYHGPGAAEAAQVGFEKQFSKREVPDNIPIIPINWNSPQDTWLPNIIKASGITISGSQASRLIEQGAVEIEGEKITDRNYHLSDKVFFADSVIIKIGKKHYFKIVKKE